MLRTKKLAFLAPVLFALSFSAAAAEQGTIFFRGGIVMEACQTQPLGSQIKANCLTTNSMTSESTTMPVQAGSTANLRRVTMQALPMHAEGADANEPSRFIVRVDYH
jgi:type 1 fimbria pilin